MKYKIEYTKFVTTEYNTYIVYLLVENQGWRLKNSDTQEHTPSPGL